ncbi:MAG: DUF2235 domain-containing protein [Magnetococcales bacterium]|nr:DUF2235 domain-containing protein [Magnetococcales bacterium]
MSKKIILCFDGTSNDPEDADQKENLLGEPEDASVTNFFELHLLFGGGLKGEQAFAPDQCSFYYSGVGTRGGPVKRVFNALLAPENADVRDIINQAGKDLSKNYQSGDEIFLFGFSRGAALARRFASVIGEYVNELAAQDSIRFIGVFDTVASIGLPDLNRRDQPQSDVVFEDQCVSKTVREALHLLALDEKRLAFRPTLMKEDSRVTEVWFPGVHSDVGGGFRKDGLSDVTLTFLLSELHRRNLGLKIRSPESINYKAIDTKDVDIDYDDIIIEPNSLAPMHPKKRPLVISRVTLASRELRVDGTGVPIIHQSVVERIHDGLDYRPVSLREVQHKVMNVHGAVSNETFDGLKAHLQESYLLGKPLPLGQTQSVIVQSYIKLNRTFILVEAGKSYSFQVDMTQKWYDASIECGPDGWNLVNQKLGFKEPVIFLMQPFRRNPDADWFEVVGVVGDDKGEKVRILQYQNKPWVPRESGELMLFANDMDHLYGNNVGSITVIVKVQ